MGEINIMNIKINTEFTINDKYTELLDNGIELPRITPSAFKPTPTQNDYKKGKIKRYFVKKVNSDVLTEVSDIEYQNLLSCPFYSCFFIEWVISGRIDTIVNENTVDYGVYDTNRLTIEYYSQYYKNLSTVIIDYLE